MENKLGDNFKLDYNIEKNDIEVITNGFKKENDNKFCINNTLNSGEIKIYIYDS